MARLTLPLFAHNTFNFFCIGYLWCPYFFVYLFSQRAFFPEFIPGKVMRIEGLGYKRVCNMVGKNIRNYMQYFLCFPYEHFS